MKKLNKFFAVLVALAMMATLCVAMAFAAVPAGNPVDNVDITKILTKNAGTTTPTAHFAFNIEKNTAKGNSGAPTIDDKVFNFSNQTETTLTDSLSTIIKDAMDTDRTPNGQYAYDIYEDVEHSTQNSTDSETGIQHTYTYSTLKYRVRVYKSTDGYKFTVSQVTIDPETNEEVESKLPATDTPGETGQTTSTLSFENKYVKTTNVTPDGGDPTDPENPDPSNDAAGLSVQKTVANDTAGLYDDKEFEFELKATAPAVNTIAGEKRGYAYQVVEIGSGTPVAGKSGTLVPGDGTEAATKIYLTDDQRLVFTDLDVGAIISVKESDYSADFTQEATKNDTAAFAIATGETATVAETATKVIVTNTSKNKTTPEGILISNLPYIALALVAIGGLVAYVVIRRRNADEA